MYKCNTSKEMVPIRWSMLNCEGNPCKGAVKTFWTSLSTYLWYQVVWMCPAFSLLAQILIYFVSPACQISSIDFSQLEQQSSWWNGINSITSQPRNTSASQGSYVAVQGYTHHPTEQTGSSSTYWQVGSWHSQCGSCLGVFQQDIV